jgi:hypothetical protein
LIIKRGQYRVAECPYRMREVRFLIPYRCCSLHLLIHLPYMEPFDFLSHSTALHTSIFPWCEKLSGPFSFFMVRSTPLQYKKVAGVRIYIE